ncbi:lipid phosphate phosphatase [Entamoeba marina]
MQDNNTNLEMAQRMRQTVMQTGQEANLAIERRGEAVSNLEDVAAQAIDESKAMNMASRQATTLVNLSMEPYTIIDIIYLIGSLLLSGLVDIISINTPFIPSNNENPTTLFPFINEETVPFSKLWLFYLALPIGVFLVVAFGKDSFVVRIIKHLLERIGWSNDEVVDYGCNDSNEDGLSSKFHKFSKVVTIFAVALTTSLFITKFLNVTSGRPRPHYWDRLSVETTNEVNKSFPSKHSSMIFTGMNYGDVLIFMVVPIFCGGYVAITRTRDYYNNFDDVIAGLVIGFFSSCSVYFIRFQSLFSNKSGNIRVWVDTDETNEELV